MTENKTFYIKFGRGRAVGIETHFGHQGRRRDAPLANIDQLTSVAKSCLRPLTNNSILSNLYLQIPAGIERSSLSPKLCLNDDLTNTFLVPNCPLSALDQLGTTMSSPLILVDVGMEGNTISKQITRNDVDYSSSVRKASLFAQMTEHPSLNEMGL
jgi:hypothetical protein